MSKRKGISYEVAIAERYRRRKNSVVADILIETYLAGVSVRHMTAITDTLWNNRGYAFCHQ